MPIESLTVTVVAAGAAVLGVLVTAWSNARSLRWERDKFAADRHRLNAEVAKLAVETERLRNDSNNFHKAKNEIELALIEHEKSKLVLVLETRRTIYPQLLELVYRLRNDIRSISCAIENYKASKYVGDLESARDNLLDALKRPPHTIPFVGLWELTEDLYRNRAFIDHPIWEKLHQFKRIAQDLATTIDLATRSPDDFFRGFEEMNKYLDGIVEKFAPAIELQFPKIEALYGEISTDIRTYFQALAERAGMSEDLARAALNSFGGGDPDAESRISTSAAISSISRTRHEPPMT
jgi:outer membrane murein-binding lipoprotein Lpp